MFIMRRPHKNSIKTNPPLSKMYMCHTAGGHLEVEDTWRTLIFVFEHSSLLTVNDEIPIPKQ